jgi:hypothetical protein
LPLSGNLASDVKVTSWLESIVIAVETALSSMPVEVNVVNVPAAAVEPPITVLSIVPPSMSGVFTSGDVKVLFVSV